MANRSGELAMRALPAVLLDLHEEFATGKLTLRRGRIIKSIDLVNGNAVSSASTPRDETLGHFLVANGVISEAHHRQAVARAAQAGSKLGEALIAIGSLTFEQLIDQLGKQARYKLIAALRWPQGAWRFDPAAAIEGLQLRMIDLVLSGLKETAVEDLGRLARLDGMSFVLTERGKRLRGELRKVFGDRVIAPLQPVATIGDIERAVGDRAAARIAVDSLLMCDAIEARVADVGMGASAAKATKEVLAIPDPSELPITARAPTRPKIAGSALFDILFEDLGDADDGAQPVELAGAEDSGVVSTAELFAASQQREQLQLHRQALAAEHQRIQGADHYAVLLIHRRATGREIEAAAKHRLELCDTWEPSVVEARERAKLADLRKAYGQARNLLGGDRTRAAYDRELAGGELVQVTHGFDAELSFRMAEEMLARHQWTQAISLIRTVIAKSPGEADFHAALGWAEWKAGNQAPGAADLARPALNTALEIDPDHAAAHEYKGRIEATLRSDDVTALFHLERALDLDPTRADLVAVIAELLIARGELRRYERVLKRLLFRLRGRGTVGEAKAWARLARLYLDHLDDEAAGNSAAANARRIAPRDSDVAALIERSQRNAQANEPARTGWREALGDPSSGARLVTSTAASGHADAAFLAAATMVGLGTADSEMAAVYERGRATAPPWPSGPLTRDQWALLRHRDDGSELGALMELVAPAVHRLAPMTLADSDLDPTHQLADRELPQPFVRLRDRCAELLGVTVGAVYPKVELGNQIHVVSTNPPVLVAGDDALTAPERPELVFRLARALTYLWPGRAVGASRPGRVLRAIVMAVFREAAGSTVGSDDPLASQANAAVAELAPDARVAARAAALRLLSRGGGLNLSLWARSLSRTADRVGLVICGDIPAAFATARDGGDLEQDLVEFAFSGAHVQLRAHLGLASR